MFGQSITKEILQQSKKDIQDMHADSDEYEDKPKNVKGTSVAAPGAKKPALAIEIDENEDFDQVNNQAQKNLNDKLAAMEQNNQEEEVEEVVESDILEEFDKLYNNDPELKQMLGEFPERYTVEEKLSIIQAYKKGGGVAGLAEIIDDEDED